MKSQKSEINLYKFEDELLDKGYRNICGIDEAGRGALAGPVCIAACILPPFLRIDGINDSKQLSAKKREELYKIIIKQAISYSVVFIHEKDIDTLNIYQATKKGKLECLDKIQVKPDYVLVDAMPLGNIEYPHEAIIHGDALSASIAAASILAKVSRDHYMEKMDIKYPNYGFKKHKGYGTKDHLDAISKNGPCKIHRKTFAPINRYFSKQLSLDLEFDDTIEDNN